MFKFGDTVKFKTGKTEYQVSGTSEATNTVDLTGAKVDKYDIAVDRLVLVEATPEFATDPAEFEEAPELMDRIKTLGGAQDPAETVNVVIRDEVPVHIPGESPAAYKARTGLKLDGRRTVLGRSVLAALQAKLAPQFRKTKISRKARKLAQEGV